MEEERNKELTSIGGLSKSKGKFNEFNLDRKRIERVDERPERRPERRPEESGLNHHHYYDPYKPKSSKSSKKKVLLIL